MKFGNDEVLKMLKVLENEEVLKNEEVSVEKTEKLKNEN
jgi:hypothetical protein